MGIDVYLKWDGMTNEEYEAQLTGFSVTSGDVGYLREAYHGEPYATHELITEDWSDQPYNEDAERPDYKGCGFSIPNEVLKKRLPKVLKVVKEREITLYKGTLDDVYEVQESYKDFVALHGELEKNGKNPRIIISF